MNAFGSFQSAARLSGGTIIGVFVTVDAFPFGWLGAVPMVLCLLLWITRTVFVVNLTSVEPFWLRKNGLPNTYPPIDEDQNVDILVVGAGVTGAMIAQRLAEDGFSIVVVDRRDVCTGSTAASTALLQYEIDLTLLKMAQIIGLEKAQRAYTVSHQSIDHLSELIGRLKIQCDFERKTSLYLATDRKAAKLLADEARARKAIKLDVKYHPQSEVSDRFHVSGVAALSSKQAASCDPYLLSHGLLKHAVENGAKIFDRTEITDFRCDKHSVTCSTGRGPKIVAGRAIIATGYESQNLLKERVVNLDNTYALVSQPLLNLGSWDRNWMMWEAKTPYLYLRITGENRLLVGGEDDAFHSPARRDANVASKAKIIEIKVRKLLPDLDWEIEFAWGGTFGTTKDGLAYVGPTTEYPSCLFALGFGGNGITFSSIATNIISEMVKGQTSANADLFRFAR